MLAGPLHADSAPGRATQAAKEAAGKLLDRVKCPAFSPLDLHNGFPNTVKVTSASNRRSVLHVSGCTRPSIMLESADLRQLKLTITTVQRAATC